MFPDDPTKLLGSVTLRFQHLETANVLLVESLAWHGHGQKVAVGTVGTVGAMVLTYDNELND